MEHSNGALAFVSWLFTLPGTMFALISGDAPLWLMLLSSVLIPLFIGVGGKAVDIYYTHYRKKDGK